MLRQQTGRPRRVDETSMSIIQEKGTLNGGFSQEDIIDEIRNQQEQAQYSTANHPRKRHNGSFQRGYNTLPEGAGSSPYAMNEALTPDLSELQPLNKDTIIRALEARFKADKYYVSALYSVKNIIIIINCII